MFFGPSKFMFLCGELNQGISLLWQRLLLLPTLPRFKEHWLKGQKNNEGVLSSGLEEMVINRRFILGEAFCICFSFFSPALPRAPLLSPSRSVATLVADKLPGGCLLVSKCCVNNYSRVRCISTKLVLPPTASAKKELGL